MIIFSNKIIFRYISKFLIDINIRNIHYRLVNYRRPKTHDKEVIAMEGITKIEIPEIDGLRETFAESTASYSAECEPGHPCQ